MSYGEPKPQHRNAIAAVGEARQQALQALSVYREVEIDMPHENLSPPGETLPVKANQRAADYFLQLRPYRSVSRGWDSIVADVELPKEINGGEAPGDSSAELPPLKICRQPRIQIGDMTDLLETINSTVVYTTKRPKKRDNQLGFSDTRVTPKVNLGGTCWIVDKETCKEFQRGNLTPDDIRALGEKEADNEQGSNTTDEFTPADPVSEKAAAMPSRRGESNDLKNKKFKIVFPPGTLLRMIEAADEIAAEMDLLAELEPPDHSAGGGDAV